MSSYQGRAGRTDHHIVGLDMAQAFWALLLPLGLQGGALAHIVPRPADSEGEYDDEDDAMTGVEEDGWQEEFTTLWFEFLQEKGSKGISKDTWQMVCSSSADHQS